MSVSKSLKKKRQLIHLRKRMLHFESHLKRNKNIKRARARGYALQPEFTIILVSSETFKQMCQSSFFFLNRCIFKLYLKLK